MTATLSKPLPAPAKPSWFFASVPYEHPSSEDALKSQLFRLGQSFAHDIPRHKKPLLTLEGKTYFVAAFGFAARSDEDRLSDAKAFVLALPPEDARYNTKYGYRLTSFEHAVILAVPHALVLSEWDVT